MGLYSKYWSDWNDITRDASRSARLANAPALLLRGSAGVQVTSEDFEALRLATQERAGSESYELPNLDHSFAMQELLPPLRLSSNES